MLAKILKKYGKEGYQRNSSEVCLVEDGLRLEPRVPYSHHHNRIDIQA